MTSKALAVLVAMAVAAGLAARPAQAQVTNRIVAYVNDDVITQGDINLRLSGLLQDEDPASLTREQAEDMRRALIQRLIEERLVLQEGKRTGLKVEHEEVAQRVQEIQKRLQGPENFQEMLRQAGLNEEQLKAKLREQLLIQKTIDTLVRAKIHMTPAELAKVELPPPKPAENGDAVHAYHLLIRVTPECSLERARARAAELHAGLQRGSDFSEMARRFSEGPHAAAGGDMGWVRPGELLPELDAVLFTLEPGQLSDPIPTDIGVHLVKVVERGQPAAKAPFSEAEQRELQLYQQKFGKGMAEWLQRLKDKAYIQIVAE